MTIPEWEELTSVEGFPLIGGRGRSRLRLRAANGLLLEVAYPATVSSPEHSHRHESYIYLLSGHLEGTVNGQRIELLPGDTVLHPSGTRHSIVAVTDSQWLEFKSPPEIVWA